MLEKRSDKTQYFDSLNDPVGIKTISISIGEEIKTIEEVYEPYLIQLGFIKRTPQGRETTLKAYEHLGILKEKISEDNLIEMPKVEHDTVGNIHLISSAIELPYNIMLSGQCWDILV